MVVIELKPAANQANTHRNGIRVVYLYGDGDDDDQYFNMRCITS